jgi:hypothetical protein
LGVVAAVGRARTQRNGVPDILDKIQKLVRLATNNPNASEAHAAALKAVRLIVDYRIRLTLPGAPPFVEPAPPTPSPPTPSPQEYDDFWRRSWAQYGQQAYNPPPRQPPPPRKRKKVPSPFRHWRMRDVIDMFQTERRDFARIIRRWRPPPFTTKEPL